MYAIRADRAFDGAQFIRDATVLIDGTQIVAISAGAAELPDGCRLRDFGAATVLPGLIDAHVHLVADSADAALDRVAGYSDVELDAVMTDGLRRNLAAGVTTVRDLGDRNFSALLRRDAQAAAGYTDGLPTIQAAGPPITSPGGHCHYLGGEAADRAALAAAVAERAERGVDIVKVMSSGGMLTLGTDVLAPQFSDADLQFLCDAAHAAGLRITAHAHALAAVEQVLAAEVDGIEHCSCLTERGPVLSDDLLEQLAGSQVVVGGALGAPKEGFLNLGPQALATMQRMHTTPEQMMAKRRETTARMLQAGVRLIASTDAGIAEHKPHGSVHLAVADLVEAGASPAAALAAATAASAAACGLGEQKGRLRAGFDADLGVVDGDLSIDPEALTQVRAVVLRGTLTDA